MPRQKIGIFIKCIFCKEDFYITRSRTKRAKYCSRKCKADYCKKEITKNCETCGIEFSHKSVTCSIAKYCSKKCRVRAFIIQDRGTRSTTCLKCKKIFHHCPGKERKFCSNECFIKSRMDSNSFPKSREYVREFMKRRGLVDRCQICGYKENINILGVHHKDENKKNNSVENLIILCANCHSLIHNRHIIHR